jgi:hypothetical protein
MIETRRGFLEFATAACIGSALPLRGYSAHEIQPAQLRFGVNYTPRRLWWYCWQDWNQQAIQDDLDGIAALGMDHIRAQCLWPIFQPGINVVNERAVEHLHQLLEAADRSGLDVEVTVLNGWMSGLSFLPAWTAPLARPQKNENWNLFTSPEVLEAQKLLFHQIAEIIGSHRRFLGFDIGNELGVLMTGANAVEPVLADQWAGEILNTCSQFAPGRFHVNGADHSHWFADFGFSRSTLANTGAATAIHSYIYFDGVLDRFAYDSPQARHLAAYEVELATAYQHDPARPVWVEEIGVGDVEMPATAKPNFMRHTVHNLARCSNLWGITWWCSHDIDPKIASFGSYEYTLGLLDLSNRPKPQGKEFATLAHELRTGRPAPTTSRIALVIPDRGLSQKPWPSDWRYASAWMNLMTVGKDPAIVLESRAKDQNYLRLRGITSLIPLTQA